MLANCLCLLGEVLGLNVDRVPFRGSQGRWRLDDDFSDNFSGCGRLVLLVEAVLAPAPLLLLVALHAAQRAQAVSV